MAIEAEGLIFRPFREVVERGDEAIANADHAGEAGTQLAKAGQTLKKEGGRALKRLQLLWKEHGDDAVRSLMATNNDILEKQRRVDDLLYDFEDFIDIDTLDETKHEELQAATRALAVASIEAIRRASLEPRTAFPPLPPIPPMAIRTAPRVGGPSPPPLNPKSPLRGGRNRKQSTGQSRTASNASNVSHDPLGRSPPVMDFETTGQTPPNQAHDPMSRSLPVRNRELMSSSRPARGQSMMIQPTEAEAQIPAHAQAQAPHTTQLRQKESWDEIPMKAREWTNHMPPARHGSAPVPRSHPLPHLTPIDPLFVARDALALANSLSSANSNSSFSDPVSAEMEMLRVELAKSHIVGTPTSPDDQYVPWAKSRGPGPQQREGGYTMFPGGTRTSTTSGRTRSGSNTNHSQSSSQQLSTFQPSLFSSPPQVMTRNTSVSESAPLEQMTTKDDCVAAAMGYPPWRSVRLSMDANTKNFCIGASTFRKGGRWTGEHWDAVRKVGHDPKTASLDEYSFNQVYAPMYMETLARCSSCEFGFKYNELTSDFEGDPSAHFVVSGVRHRRRFLYKSHVSTSAMGQLHYACVFCHASGSKPCESDATVFASTGQLFEHLARHPHPLPDVPGVVVLYGEAAPDQVDYDVNFTSEPLANAAEDPSIAYLPVAIATKDHLYEQVSKMALPDQETLPLLFFSGARIVGVEFPQKWDAKWCTGWHDGAFGAFPAKSMQLEPPTRTDMRPAKLMESKRSGVVKWKFQPKTGAKAGWLELKKGETLSNLSWDDADVWYWTGSNSKGQFGIFPSSHMNLDTIKDGSLGAEVPVAKKAGRSVFRFRRASTAGSGSGPSLY